MHFFLVPADPVLSAINSSELWSKLGPAIGVILFILLIGHFVAAKLLIPGASVRRVLGAFFVHIAFAAIMIPVSLFFSLAGVGPLGIASLVIILIGGAVTAGIYKVGVGRGIIYNFAVLLAITGIAWGSSKVLESEYNPLVYFYGKKPESATQGQASSENGASGQSASTSAHKPSSFYATSQEAQAAAMKQYPELGQAGSAFNKRFLEKHRVYKEQNHSVLNSPDWPISVAREVAAELKAP